MLEDGRGEGVRPLDVGEMRCALEDHQPRSGDARGDELGVCDRRRGSSSPAITSTGAAIAEMRSRASQAPTASQQRA